MFPDFQVLKVGALQYSCCTRRTPALYMQLDYTQRVRQARRASEMWAYYMLCEEGDMMRQPCTVPLVDTIPFTLREKVVRAYARCITDLQIATADRLQATQPGFFLAVTGLVTNKHEFTVYSIQYCTVHVCPADCDLSTSFTLLRSTL